MTTQKTKPSRFKHFTAKVGAILVTSLFFVIAGSAVWQGSNLIADRANAVAPPQATDPVLVRAGQITLLDHYTVSRAFTGQIEAPRSVNIGFETAGIINRIFFDEGDKVENGEILAILDDRLLKAEIKRLTASKAALEAQRELAILTNERQSKLRKKGFATGQIADQSRLNVVEIDALLAEVDATILAAEIRLEKATVRAPFAGNVDQRLVDPGTTIRNGEAILALVEDDAPVFRVGIDPDLASRLAVGDKINVELNTNSFEAAIIAILPKIDPVTRTRIVRAVLRSPVDLAFGLTGRITIDERVPQSGAWLPLEAIEDGVRGLWTIKTLSDDEIAKVGVEAVEILHADEDKAFVQGTFEPGSRFILSGLHRVAPGQHVRVID
ncbi:MAG: efflux RND transporter periplasmic adaptor subunit [Pseudomonadota bacterium]